MTEIVEEEADFEIMEDGVPEMAFAMAGGGAAENAMIKRKGGAEPKAASELATASDDHELVGGETDLEATHEEAPENDFMQNIESNTRWYSHKRREDWSANERVDMTETVFYSATQPLSKSGKFSGEFYLSDLITEFRITANAFSSDGVLGYNSANFQAAKPFYIQYELPSSFLVGDILDIPVTINNFYSQSK